MNSWIKAYFYSSIHIAIVGAFYFVGTRSSSGTNIGLEAFIVAGAIFCVYNMMRIVRINDFEAIQNNEHLSWVSSHLTEIITAMLGFLVTVMLLLPIVTLRIQNLLIVFLIAMYPLLRNIPFAKNGIIAICWGYMPFLFSDSIMPSKMIFYSLFFLWLSMWYDLKDPNENRLLARMGLIPYYVMLLLILTVILLVGYQMGFSLSHIITLGAIGIIGMLCMYHLKTSIWYLVIVDSLILIPILFRQ